MSVHSLKKEYTFSTKLFSSHVLHTKTKTYITMQVFTKDVHTGNMKHTLSLLKEMLPTILQSTCFNEGNIPFKVEVMRTELGHLFEHILLEYLCQLKLSQGFEEAAFSGTTDWNWNKYPRGTFHITISAGTRERDIFLDAFQKSSSLFEFIIKKHTPKFTPIQRKKEAVFTLPLQAS